MSHVLPSTSRDCRETRRRILEAHVGIPFTTGNLVQVLHNGDEIFPALLNAIRSARQFVHLLTYIYEPGKVTDQFHAALCDRAQAGVAVRVLLDAVGGATIPRSHIRSLKSAGVELVWFRRPYRGMRALTHRTHRKVLVCDGAIGFTGGVGIAPQWEGDARNPDEWREAHFAFRGPAVDGLNGSFWENWTEPHPDYDPVALHLSEDHAPGSSHVQVVNSGSGALGFQANITLRILIWMARRRLDLITPYLTLSKHVLAQLTAKARSGVKVRLLIPGPHIDVAVAGWESERYFQPLLNAGARIFTYQPTMMHTKLILVDDHLILGGSLNLNQRSLKKDEETLVVIDDPSLVHDLDKKLAEDFANAKELVAKNWRHPTLPKRILRFMLRPFHSHL